MPKMEMKMKRIFAIFLTLCIICPSLKSVCADTETEIYYTNSAYYSESGVWYNSELLGNEDTKSRYSIGKDEYAKWSIPVTKNGYYRVFFYNIMYTNNSKAVKVSCDDAEKIFNHNGSHDLSGFEDLGIIEKKAGDSIEITVSCGDAGGFFRTNSIKLEYYPFTDEIIYQINNLKKISGTWNVSSLFGYNNTASVYGVGESSCRWDIKNKGVADLYYYNLVNDGNCQTAYLKICSADGSIIYETQMNHNSGENGLIYLGNFDFNGDEYVEISNSAKGYLRVNTLRAVFYCKGFSQDTETEYPKRTLYERNADITDTNRQNIYVKSGSTNGDGSFEKPFATPKEAQEKVRELIKKGYPENGITVNLADGTYFLDSAMNFSGADSGTKAKSVIWQATGENVKLTTSQMIRKSEFEKVTDYDVLKRIPDGVSDKVYSVRLNETLSEMSISSPYMVVFDDTEGSLAKWPNNGFARTGNLADIGTRSDSGPKQRGFTYIIDDSRIFNWKNEKNGWLRGYWMTPYTMDYVKISEIDDGKMTVSGLNGTSLGAYDYARYNVLNMMCELDADREWYIEDDVLYTVMPEACENVYISYNNSGIIKTSGAHDIVFKGINLINCMGTAVTFDNSTERCGIVGAEIKNTTGNGAVIYGKECYIRDCDISYVGSCGILIQGGNQYRLIQGKNIAENNTVTKTGRTGTSKAGINIGGCGNTASNNHIYDVPTHGITGSGMETTICKNIVERTNLEMGDTGGIYFLNYGMGYGTRICYNIVKDSVGLNKTEGFANEGALGIYLDDMTSGVEVVGNIVYNCREPALFGHGGRHLTFKNNMIINCDESIRLVKTSISKNLDPQTGSAAVNIRNYNTVEVNSKYPEALNALTDEYGEAKYNTVINNVIYNSFKPELEQGTSNEGIVYGNLNYEESPESDCTDFYDFDFSDIMKDNPEFEPIPINDIGTYKGGMRKDDYDIVYDNRSEAFNICEPQNGSEGLDKLVTFKWETNVGGVKSSSLYVSEYPDMAYAKKYDSSENSITVDLEYGKKYYWCVINKPFFGYANRQNSNGIFEFSTIGCEDKYKSIVHSMNFLLKTADQVEFEGIEKFKKKITEFNGIADINTAITFGEAAIEEMLSSIKTFSDMETNIFDTYTNDIIGQKPFGLFQRSNGNLDIKTAYLPESDNKGVRFNDTDENSHYTSRSFYPEDKYVEFSTRVIPMQTNGQFSIALIKAEYYATKDGVSGGNAARVIFDTDGIIYADKGKMYPIMSYYPNNSYDVKIKLDIKKQSYDVFVNGEKKAENIGMNCDGVKSVGSILYDTSDATISGKLTKGEFYIDNTVVKTPVNYGDGSYLTSLYVNGIKQELYKPVIETGLTHEELLNADIEYTVSQNAKIDIKYDDGAYYVTVISGNMENVSSYIIKQ